MNAPKRRYRRRPNRKPAAASTPTRLQHWLDTNGFTSAELEAETELSRQAMTKIRAAIGDVRRSTMIRILDGACFLAQRKVQMDELFDLEPQRWRE
ncbi:MAG: hypothetical protein M3P06_05330 [Acidobacteriota bacterium]|nr:hypothetical protein [Acidobacteriota bacterium]